MARLRDKPSHIAQTESLSILGPSIGKPSVHKASPIARKMKHCQALDR